MNRRILLVLLLLGICGGSALAAQQDSESEIVLSKNSAPTITPLVELYTSEGCSSCPPADQFLGRLAGLLDDQFRAVPLAFHVDYWNWLGWTDPFSKEQFAERQRVVAAYNARRSIYTPELVVAGKEARGGGQIFDWITKINSTKSSVDIKLRVIAKPLIYSKPT